ncbi:MAG: MFS transporter, partial [Longimicrobiales bacterium]
ALGVYRLWRDSGYAVGALGAGLAADRIGLAGSLAGTACVMLMASCVFALAGRATGANVD